MPIRKSWPFSLVPKYTPNRPLESWRLMAGRIGSFKLEYRMPKINAEASPANNVSSKIDNKNLKCLKLQPHFEKIDHKRPTSRQHKSKINPCRFYRQISIIVKAITVLYWFKAWSALWPHRLHWESHPSAGSRQARWTWPWPPHNGLLLLQIEEYRRWLCNYIS